MKTSKHKKQKKYKKHKRERKASSSSSNEEFEWVESKQAKQEKDYSKESSPKIPEKIQAQPSDNDWLSHCLSSSASTSKINEPKEIKECIELGQHERELNPYWKNGGTGLPESELKDNKASTSIIGDGGARWYKRAYQRILERAAEENKDPEEIAKERWGSLSKLKSLINDAEACRSENSHSSHSSKYKPRDHHYSSHKHDKKQNDSKRQSLFSKPKLIDDYDYERTFKKEVYDDDKQSYKKEKYNKPKLIEDTESSSKKDNESYSNPPPTSAFGNRVETNHEPPDSQQIFSSGSRILTDSEKNQLNAKIFKAELKGKDELVAKLKAELEESERAEKEVLLTQTNSSGFTFPVPQDRNSYSRNKPKSKHQTHDSSGVRTSYLPDDHEYSLKQMFEREKMTTARDQNSLFMSNANKMSCKDDEFDDILLDRASRKVPKLSGGDRMNAIKDHQKLNSVRDRCKYCLEHNSANGNLVVEHFPNVYLMLPPTTSLADGHCFIVPRIHISASLLLDEDIQEEIKEVKRKLIEHFATLEKFPVFLETSTGRFYHTVIECIPVPRDMFHDAPMYFKKAIQESDTEWSDNKKLIDLYKKDLQHSVPKNMPYFAVQFGLGGGFAHVIEDHRLFTRHFGQEILGNLLDADPQAWLKPHFESHDAQKQKMKDFLQLWGKQNVE